MIRSLLKISVFVLFLSQLVFTQNNKSIAVFDLNKDRLIGLFDWEYLVLDTNDMGVADSSWVKMKPNDYNLQTSKVITFRKKILLEGNADDSDLLALLFYNVCSAYEIYWDGQLVGVNGKVGRNDETVESGIIRLYIPLKYSYTLPGEHTIYVKSFASCLIENITFSQIVLGYSSEITWEESVNTNKNILFLTFFFTMVLVSLSLYISGWRNLSFLFFGIFTFLLSLKYVWLYLLDLDFVTFNFAQWFHLLIIYLTEDIAIFLLFLFIIWHLDISNKQKHIIPGLIFFILILLLSSSNHTLNFWILRLSVSVYALILIINKIKTKISGGYGLLLAFGIFLIYSLFYLYSYITGFSVAYSFFLSLIANVLIFSLIIIAISINIQDKNRQFQSVLLRTQRLESELLKKSIQPHFIMNTLLSIKSRMLKDSATAEKLIDALANQFRIINEISSKREIPLEEEINLCKLHLELMGYRFNATYNFILKGNISDKKIPPLVFHTLVENAFTHAYLPKENGTFNFECKSDENYTLFIISNDGSQLADINNKSTDEIDEGLGLKYVKTRLQETYHDLWQLDYGMVNNVWEVKIKIHT